MSKILVVDLDKKVANDGGSPWAPATFSFGESFTLGLQFTQTVGGSAITPSLIITGMKASLGNLDARPSSGEWALQIGPGAQTGANTTAPIPHDCSAAVLASAVNAVTAAVAIYGACVAKKSNGNWRLVFGTGALEVPLKVVNNSLYPSTLGNVTADAPNGIWVQTLRLVQCPVAWTNTSASVLGDPPLMTTITEGGGGGGASWNTVQSLFVPPSFTGDFTLSLGFAQTALLDKSDTPATIQAALVAALGANVAVTSPTQNTANIEFTGIYAGTPVDQLTVTPHAVGPGNLTFTVDLTKDPLLQLLRAQGTSTLGLEVWILVQDPVTEVVTPQVAFRTQLTVQLPQVYAELETVPDIEWLRPPSPKDYIPFSAGTVITGQQFYPKVLGDASATAFTFTHGLATEFVFVSVRQNISNGLQLVPGVDYSVRIVDANSVTVTALLITPGVNAWLATVMSAQTVGAFAAGLTVTEGQVTGLRTELDAIEASLASVLALAPTSPIGAATLGSSTITIAIPDRSNLLPRSPSTAVDLNNLPRAGALLPAIHTATTTSVTVALPALAGSAGNVYVNNTGAAILLPGGYQWRSSVVPVGGFIGSDGRRFYPLTRAGTTTSYFPADFEQELFMFELNSAMMPFGASASLNFQIGLQLLQATSRLQYLAVIEWGTVPSDTSPATTSPNLQAVAWNATPLMSQRVVLGETLVPHTFGAQIFVSATGVITANQILYGRALSALSAPSAQDMAFRGRLINADTENNVSGAIGTVYYNLTSASCLVSPFAS